ncbi:hypothetical protein YC2023_007833 [Brassica napus]
MLVGRNLHSLNDIFVEGKHIRKEKEKPCIRLIDELIFWLLKINLFYTTFWIGPPSLTPNSFCWE